MIMELIWIKSRVKSRIHKYITSPTHYTRKRRGIEQGSREYKEGRGGSTSTGIESCPKFKHIQYCSQEYPLFIIT